MKRLMWALAIVLGSGQASLAHEMTPTYPTLFPSYMDNVVTTRLRLFNRRIDVEYYEIGVFDKNWNPIEFAARDRILYVKHLDTVLFDIFIREADKSRVVYICTVSKIQRDQATTSAVSSRICSKVK